MQSPSRHVHQDHSFGGGRYEALVSPLSFLSTESVITIAVLWAV